MDGAADNMETERNKRTITLRSSDGVRFEESAEQLAKKSLQIKGMIFNGEKMELDVPVGSKILHDAIEYCKRHAEDKKTRWEAHSFGIFEPAGEEEGDEEDDEGDDDEMEDPLSFAKEMGEMYREYLYFEDEEPVLEEELKFLNESENYGMLVELIRAAYYLDIMTLLDLTCSIAWKMVKGKSREEICKLFNVKSVFTGEEMDAVVRSENESMKLKRPRGGDL